MAKVRIGMMLITERPVGQEPLKAQIMGNYELLLMDGREIDPKGYPRLAELLRKNGLGKNLPNEQQDEDIQDHYAVARRLSRVERNIVERIRTKAKGAKTSE